MRFDRFLLSFALVCACAATTTAGTIRHDRDPQLYLDLAAQPEFDAVGRLRQTTASGGKVNASGTLIAPNVVLTAAHCVDQALALDFTVSGTTYSATQWVAHPQWTGNLAAGYDLGLLLLSSPVSGIAPATRYTGSAELGLVGTAVGFGKTGTGLSGALTFDGQKRAGTNVLDALYNPGVANPRILVTDFDNPDNPADSHYGSFLPTDLEYQIANADSGGALFIPTADGLRLAGVHTFGGTFDGNLNADYGDISGHSRVSQFNSWIDEVLASWGVDITGGGILDSSGDPASVPEPSTWALALVGALALLVRGRRSARPTVR